MSGSTPLDVRTIDGMIDAMESPRDRAALLLACGCGLRAGTLQKLRLTAVLNSRHELTGKIEIPRRALKGQRKAHTVDIPARALQALANWIAQHPQPHRQAPIFPSSKRPELGICPRPEKSRPTAHANSLHTPSTKAPAETCSSQREPSEISPQCPPCTT